MTPLPDVDVYTVASTSIISGDMRRRHALGLSHFVVELLDYGGHLCRHESSAF